MTKENYKDYLKRLLVIAVPIILSNIISQVQMLIDRAFLGHVDNLYMSALSNVNSPIWTTMSFCFSLVVGASIIISQKVGAGKKDQTEEYAAAMMKWNNVIPLVLFVFWALFSEPVFRLMGVSEALMPICLEYARYFIPCFLILGLEASSSVIMQTSNYTKPLVYFGIVRAGLNLFLDWALIFGNLGFPALGIKGAAIATTIAEYAGFIYCWFIFVSSKKLPTRPRLKTTLKAPLKPFLVSARLGLNTALEDFGWNFGNLMMIRILNTINDMAAGIYTIVFSVEILVVVVFGALGQGTMTLSGEAVGKKDRDQYKGVCIVAYALSAVVALVLLVFALIMPQKIIAIFTSDANIIATCSMYLLMICLNLFCKAGNIIVGNGIRGSGDTAWMFYTQIFGTIGVIACASLFVFVFKWGIAGVFAAVMLDEAVRTFVNLAKYISISKKLPAAIEA
ncbi:MAG: MATE family efflux transporter [Treponemataceae bacterium]|nr:MATE family efflux transporter [Treponemataceae bacterium]